MALHVAAGCPTDLTRLPPLELATPVKDGGAEINRVLDPPAVCVKDIHQGAFPKEGTS